MNKHMRRYWNYAQNYLSFHTKSGLHSSKLAEFTNKTSLYRHLYAKIMACGPITVAEYMQEVLTHPTAGYYMTKDVFGQRGDFITSPEITHLFGEMIAVWIVNEFNKISNKPFQLVELGPGRGTLIQDILKVLKQLRLLHIVSVHLVEISPVLSEIQAKNLCVSTEEYPIEEKKQADGPNYYRKGVTKDGITIYWYYSVQDVPKAFSVFLAHEFFDALPIHKFQKTDKGWREVLVDIIPNVKDDKFRYVLSHSPTLASTLYLQANEARGHVEISPQTMVTTDYISTFLMEYGGFALIIDYGHKGEKEDTFRAFQKHKLHDPLLNPGSADLTADVDFSVIKRIAEKDKRLLTFGPVEQAFFLKGLGIDLRLQILLENASEEQKKQLKAGYHMITDDDKMGKRFKMLSLFPFVLKNHLQKWPVVGFECTV